MTAKHLVDNLQIRLKQEQKAMLNEISSRLTDVKLQQYVMNGIAFHHAGLVRENRYSIEEAFRQGHIPILVTTSTLAMGVNLPAHLVIIKSTKCYDYSGGYKDYDEVSIFQMIGRAGRSQFDTCATALILTTAQDKAKYENMVACTQPIESNLHKHLTEHLNAEIVLNTITDLEVAMRWLSSTFLYVRAKKCPEKYKLPVGLTQEKIDKKLLEICQIDLNKLVGAGMVNINQCIEISPTVIGEIMAKYYVAFETMKLFTKITGTEIMIQLLGIFSKCSEFSDIRLRTNDKKCLNLLNKHSTKETIRFPLSGKVTSSDMKVNCIIQAMLGNLEIHDQSILNDSSRIMRCCERLSKCK
ncbi:probable ATP-dependent DNA helicase HFM1 [Sitophilus oryzae]|uniref:DNA 3'-5' helicase n=1 Tax=Sitophilus oryzae TaxID=7048 RepID=A0A6J2XQ81_SITOR|nr:probable ATP-dependent DNA helicase HFM1 [Sitophilus oryzae]